MSQQDQNRNRLFFGKIVFGVVVKDPVEKEPVIKICILNKGKGSLEHSI